VFSLNDHDDIESVRQLSNPSSDVSTSLRQLLADDNELLGCLDYVHINIDFLLGPTIHHLRFIKDSTLLTVIEYLEIPSALRSNNMFDGLPFAYQSASAEADFKCFVDARLHAYIDFIEKVDDELLLELSRASIQLGIASLSTLIGSRMAKLIRTLGEKDIRRRFGVADDKFVDATREKLDSILKEQAWLTCAPFTSRK
jgi:hypothetical protein